MQINIPLNLCYDGLNQITGQNWQTVTNEQFNDLIAGGWSPTVYVLPYRVSKDTITYRTMEAGKLNDLINLVGQLSVEQQFLWTNFAWFWSDNQTVTSMCQQLGLDPAIILAQDPYI